MFQSNAYITNLQWLSYMSNIVNYKAFHVKHRKFRSPFDIENLSNYKKVKLRV